MARMQVDIEAQDGMSGARIEVEADTPDEAKSAAQAEWLQYHDEEGVIKGVYVEVES